MSTYKNLFWTKTIDQVKTELHADLVQGLSSEEARVRFYKKTFYQHGIFGAVVIILAVVVSLSVNKWLSR